MRKCLCLVIVGCGLVLSANAQELIYGFDAGTATDNLGSWGAGYNGTLTGNGTLMDVGLLDGAAYGYAGLSAPLNGVLHSTTAAGTATAGVGGVSFYTPEAGTNVDNSISFWMQITGGTTSDVLGTAAGQFYLSGGGGGQTHGYSSATGGASNQTWWVPVGGGWGDPAITPFDDVDTWHFYTLTFTSGWTGSNSRVYMDGAYLGHQPGNPSRGDGALLDGFGLRVGGHNGGNDVFIDNLMFSVGIMDEATASALFASQFILIPEPATLSVLGLAVAGLVLRRRRGN